MSIEAGKIIAMTYLVVIAIGMIGFSLIQIYILVTDLMEKWAEKMRNQYSKDCGD